MAKAQTFAEKVAKLAKKEAEITCPKCNKSAKLIHARLVNSVKSEKDTWRFLERNVRLCSSCLAEI